MRICRGILMAALVGVAGLAWGKDAATKPAAGAGKLPFTISKETTAITGPLKPDGTVDYVAALNEKYGKGVTPENNAFVVWLKVVGTAKIAEKNRAGTLELLGVKDEPAEAGTFLNFGQYLKQVAKLDDASVKLADAEMKNAGPELWKAQDYPHVAAYLAYEEKSLHEAEEAVARPRWWSPYVGDSVLNVNLPALTATRDVANAWCMRATLRADSGDFDGFVADVTAARRLARDVGGGAFLIERLVGSSIETWACQSLGGVAGSGRLSAQQCAALAKAMREFQAMPPISEAVDVSERWAQLEAVQEIAVGKGNGPLLDDLLGAFRQVDRGTVDWDAVLKRMGTEIDAELAGMKAPALSDVHASGIATGRRLDAFKVEAKERGIALQPNESRAAYSSRVGDLLIAVLTPSISKSEELWRQADLRSRMAEALVAAAGYRAKNGRWPENLETLVPEGLKEVPRDIYSQGEHDAVKYVVTEKGARVYSIGQNRVDDGGVNEQVGVYDGKKKDDIVVGVK